MLLMFCSVEGPDSDPKTKVYTDIFGLGQISDNLSKSFGKVIEKMPSHKFTAGLTFIIMVLIISFLFIGYLLKQNSPNATITLYWTIAFATFIICRFINAELNKRKK